MVKGRGETMTHDYKRHGTTTLFAALNVLTGMIISQCLPRHRHQEWLTFLKTIDRQVSKDLAIHLIVDNYATHKHEDVRTWLDKHPRFHLHFTPTSSSWLNLVERWFRELTAKLCAAGSFTLCPTSSPLSRNTSTLTTTTPDPTCGQLPPNPSSRRSRAVESLSKGQLNAGHTTRTTTWPPAGTFSWPRTATPGTARRMDQANIQAHGQHGKA
jgi:hypothetical protein